jgi:capsular exopolysaccharide synthesis family protein
VDAASFRLVHANLKFSCVDSPLRTVMVTSAAAAEGKSLVATNLAIVFAQQGMKTLLVDADLRRPQLHETFACEQSPGVTDVLVGGTPLLDACRATDIDNLDVLLSGDRPPNPSALLDSRRMAALIEEMKGHWEVIVFDTPPALAVADATLLCPRMDASIMVVQQGKVSFRAVAEVRRMILQARGTLVGAVMNRVSPRSGSYYYYHMDSDYSDDGGKRPQSEAKEESPAALPAK